jgi:hypothetical protein
VSLEREILMPAGRRAVLGDVVNPLAVLVLGADAGLVRIGVGINVEIVAAITHL